MNESVDKTVSLPILEPTMVEDRQHEQAQLEAFAREAAKTFFFHNAAFILEIS
ncbi:hypothetical protein [Sansalvadorimonas verongulae]|uniref:hypothetical protein n=1 Tax=Sansalvadorimonas verongulae TaxID=2172824 RepID=UPI0012BD546C|nr:hypothetical protein [Sansalvadorimonas verongulae]